MAAELTKLPSEYPLQVVLDWSAETLLRVKRRLVNPPSARSGTPFCQSQSDISLYWHHRKSALLKLNEPPESLASRYRHSLQRRCESGHADSHEGPVNPISPTKRRVFDPCPTSRLADNRRHPFRAGSADVSQCGDGVSGFRDRHSSQALLCFRRHKLGATRVAGRLREWTPRRSLCHVEWRSAGPAVVCWSRREGGSSNGLVGILFGAEVGFPSNCPKDKTDGIVIRREASFTG